MGFLSSPIFLSIVAVIALLYALPVAIGYWKLSRLTFFCFSIEPQPAEAVPDYVYEYFADAIATLESHQFQCLDYFTVEAVKGNVEWLALLQDDNQIRAMVSTKEQTPGTNPVTVILSTFLTDYGLLETINQIDPEFFPAQARCWQNYVGDVSVDELLQMHRQKLDELSASETVLSLTAAQYFELGKAHSIQRAEHFRQVGAIYWVEPQVSYRLSWRKVATLIANHFRKQWFRKQPPVASQASTSTPVSIASRVERDFVEFQRQQQRENRLSRRTRSWLFLGTLAFFIVAYSSLFNFQGLVIFVAVLLLHEGGHVLAMKLFGYRDTAMLFIPFLGALATARKDDATLTEKVWISLAGPLPGLVLGMGLAIAFHQGWLAPASWGEEAVLILVFLNVFNLLPMYPLDGGQVADVLLFSRHPHLGVIFKAMGTGLLLLLGLVLGTPLLVAFAVLIGLSIPSSFRLAKLNSQLRSEFHATASASLATSDADTLARHLFQHLQHPPYEKLTFAQKSTLITGILQRRKEEGARWTTRVGLSSIYLASLLIGLVGGIAAIMATPNAIEATETELIDPTESAVPITNASTPYSCQADGTQQTTITQNNAVMRDRQITLIGTFDTPAQAQATWQTLQPQLQSEDSARLFGQTIFVSTFNTQTQQQVDAILDAAAATVLAEDWLSGDSTVIRITAEAPNHQQATTVAESLSNFFTVADYIHFAQLRAPWDTQTTLEPEQLWQQTKARYTYAQLVKAEETAYSQITYPNLAWLQMIAGHMIGQERWATSAHQKWMTELYQAQRAAAQQLLDSGENRIDVETVNLFLAELSLQQQQMESGYAYYYEDDEGADEKRMATFDQQLTDLQTRLSERLGANYLPNEEEIGHLEYADNLAAYWLYGEVKQSGTTVNIEELASSQTQETLPAIVAYLCDRQFSNIRYHLADQSEM